MSTNQIPATTFNLGSLEDQAKLVRKKPQKPPKGTTVYKIAPPFGKNNGGSLHHEWNIHWVQGANGPMPMQCSRHTEGYCPFCAKYFELSDELKRAEGSANKELADKLKAEMELYKVNRSFVYNAIGKDGQFIILSLGKTAHDQLRLAISDAVYKKGFDPTDLNAGAWFQITRTGEGFKTEYKVDFHKIPVNVEGEVLEKIDKAPLPLEIVKQIKEQMASNSAEPLTDIHSIYEPTTAQQLRDLISGNRVVTTPSPAPAQPQAAPMASGYVQQGAVAPPAVATPVKPDYRAEMARLKALQESTKEA